MESTNNQILIDLLPETMENMATQLRDDYKRWGNTWQHRDIRGQDDRIAKRLQDYIDQYRNAGQPLPYARIACLAHIAMVRIAHEELLED